MDLTLLIILIGLLGVVVYQDFKNKEISWFLIPLLFIGFTIRGVLKLDTEELIYYSGINLLIVIINLLGVTIMISLKEKKITNIIDSYLGLGDVLFFILITIAFSPINFIAFYLGSVLLTSIVYGGIILINKNKRTLIPLAGAMSVLLIIALVVEKTSSSFQFYQDVFMN